MKTRESQGFFCVVYLILKTEDRIGKNGEVRTVITEGKTVFYHKYWKPSKLWDYLKGIGHNIKWLKVFIDKNDYHSNPKANNYYAIFDDSNPVQHFTFKPFTKKCQ